VLAPIFPGNALREKGRGEPAPCNMKLEIAATAALLLLAALDLAAAPEQVQETDAVDSTGGSADADDDAPHNRNLRRYTSSRVFW